MALAYFLCQAMALVCFFPENKIHKKKSLKTINDSFHRAICSYLCVYLESGNASPKCVNITNNKLICKMICCTFITSIIHHKTPIGRRQVQYQKLVCFRSRSRRPLLDSEAY